MKQFVYPIVLYFNKETDCYTVAFYDLDIFIEADTVEESFLKAKEFLKAYLDCTIEFNETPIEPRSYLITEKEYDGDIILLVDGVQN